MTRWVTTWEANSLWALLDPNISHPVVTKNICAKHICFFSLNFIYMSLNTWAWILQSDLSCHHTARVGPWPSSRPAVSKTYKNCQVYAKLLVEHKTIKLFLVGFSLYLYVLIHTFLLQCTRRIGNSSDASASLKGLGTWLVIAWTIC